MSNVRGRWAFEITKRQVLSGVHISGGMVQVIINCVLNEHGCTTHYSLMKPNGVRSWSTLVQVMTWCLMVPGHYANQCWQIISEVLWHSLEAVSKEMISIFDVRLETIRPTWWDPPSDAFGWWMLTIHQKPTGQDCSIKLEQISPKVFDLQHPYEFWCQMGMPRRAWQVNDISMGQDGSTENWDGANRFNSCGVTEMARIWVPNWNSQKGLTGQWLCCCISAGQDISREL